MGKFYSFFVAGAANLASINLVLIRSPIEAGEDERPLDWENQHEIDQ